MVLRILLFFFGLNGKKEPFIYVHFVMFFVHIFHCFVLSHMFFGAIELQWVVLGGEGGPFELVLDLRVHGIMLLLLCVLSAWVVSTNLVRY